MSQWCLSYGGDAPEPFDHVQAVNQVGKDLGGYTWCDGLAEWQNEGSFLGAWGGLIDGDNR